ncbi:hypothetical protein EO087_03375 [Dyella sp. M7H15-1]|uniref:hypothetical protein n=1 Tax=Dyella sp. M7H15-1 TaxID=2501295 RepID=UPI0010050C22|nr:hypothetical protein [Dyella sp. M7H15-1]QAU23146.1 hypothetical protein EO087_03375 [Dyella sp. M7H15-1]
MEIRTSNHYIPSISALNETHEHDLKYAGDLIYEIFKSPGHAFIEFSHPEDIKNVMENILTSSDGSEIHFHLDGHRYCLWESNGDVYVSHAKGEDAQGKVPLVGHFVGNFNIQELRESISTNKLISYYVLNKNDDPVFENKETLTSSNDDPSDIQQATPTRQTTDCTPTQETVEKKELTLHNVWCENKNQSTPAHKLTTDTMLMDRLNTWAPPFDGQLSEKDFTTMKQKHFLLHGFLSKDGADIYTAIDFAAYATDENCETYASLINPNIDRVLSLPRPSQAEVNKVIREKFAHHGIKKWTDEQLNDSINACMHSSLRENGTTAFILAKELMHRRENFAKSLPDYPKMRSLKFSKDITPQHFKSTDISFHTTQNGKQINPEKLEIFGYCLLGAINAMKSPTQPTIRINIHNDRMKESAFTSRIGNVIQINVSATQFAQGMGSIIGMVAHELGVHSLSYSLSDDEKKAEEKILEPINNHKATIAGDDFKIQRIAGKKQQPDHLIIALDAFHMLGGSPETIAAIPRGQMYRTAVIGMINGLEASPSLTRKEKDKAIKETLATYCLDVARIVTTNDMPSMSGIWNIQKNGISVAMKAYELMKKMFSDDLHNVEITRTEMTEYAMKLLGSMAKDTFMGK